MTNRAMKAFSVLENSENTGGIVFADRPVVARRVGAATFGDGDFSGWSCRRAPWADPFAKSGILPIRVMIDNGWHFECCGCGASIDVDWLDDEGLPLDGVIGSQHSMVFCSEICEARHKLQRAIALDHQRRAIDALKAFVLRRFPAITFAARDNWSPHAYATDSSGAWQVEQIVVAFEFPGMKIGPASCRIERRQQNERFIGPIRPEFQCCFGDREVFEAWASSPESRT